MSPTLQGPPTEADTPNQDGWWLQATQPITASSQAQGTVKGGREAVDSASNTDHDAALALALADSGAKGSLRLLSLQKPQEDGRGQDLPQPLIGAEQFRQLLLVDGIWCPWAE